jgi:hypothetical protein
MVARLQDPAPFVFALAEAKDYAVIPDSVKAFQGVYEGAVTGADLLGSQSGGRGLEAGEGWLTGVGSVPTACRRRALRCATRCREPSASAIRTIPTHGNGAAVFTLARIQATSVRHHRDLRSPPS